MLRLKDLVVSSIVVGAVACGGGEEKQILNRFFVACRSGDNATVASVSQVTFPGECVSWELVEVQPERSEPFRLGDLTQKLAEAKQERDIQFEKGKYFLEDNYNEIEKIQLKLDSDPEYRFTGKLGEIQDEWDRIRSERKELERNVQDLNRELEKEKKLAKMSLMAQVPLDKLEGDVLTKNVLITVNDGTSDKPYNVTLTKYDLVDKETQRAPGSRWIIVDIEERAT